LGVGGRKRKRKKKARGEHQWIYIRRSIKKGGLKGIEKRVGSWGKKKKESKSKSPWTALHGSLVFECC
jgi:hypothetical protein